MDYDAKKKVALDTWINLGKPVITKEVMCELRKASTLGMMDVCSVIFQSKEYRELVENQPEIDMSQCPEEKYVKIYKPNGELLVETNQYTTYLWVRTQIKKNQLRNYYIEFEGEKIRIDPRGTESDYPDGMMDLASKLLLELI